jgi:hypothetical protein
MIATPHPEHVPYTPSRMPTHRFFVLGNQAISETTVRLAPGAYLQVRHMEGTVRFNMTPDWGPEVGPNGYARSDFNVHWRDDARFQDPLTGSHDGHAGLLAMIDGRPRFVGAKATLCSQQGGDLLLGINDATPAGPRKLGNSGGFDVEVTVLRPGPKLDARLCPLLGTWVKVSESPRRAAGPEQVLMAFDLDESWRILAPYSREVVEDGTIQEVGSLGGHDFVKLLSSSRGTTETWVFEADGKQLRLRRVADELTQGFDRL